jgi:hypothetical protein
MRVRFVQQRRLLDFRTSLYFSSCEALLVNRTVVSRNIRRLISLEKFWIFLTIGNVRSGCLICIATTEAATANKTSPPVVSVVGLCSPAGYISGTQGGSFMFHTWHQVHVNWFRVQNSLILPRNLSSKTWMASDYTLPGVKLIIVTYMHY